jgi:hypothetical protein
MNLRDILNSPAGFQVVRGLASAPSHHRSSFLVKTEKGLARIKVTPLKKVGKKLEKP